MSDKLVKKFLSSARIPHAGRRASVLYGIAAEMTRSQLIQTKRALLSAARGKVVKYQSLAAPEVIMKNVRDQLATLEAGDGAMKVVNRFLASTKKES